MSRFDNDSSSKTLSTKHNEISRDGIDRRGFLQCMAGAGDGPNRITSTTRSPVAARSEVTSGV